MLFAYHNMMYFHTIKSILNWQYLEDILLPNAYFHTIKSILNELYKEDILKTLLYFHTIKSILNNTNRSSKKEFQAKISILLSLF